MRRLRQLAIATLVAATVVVPAADGSDPAPAAAVAPVRLAPLPARAVGQCRLAAALVVCPARLPRATVGWRGAPPPLVAERYPRHRDGAADLVGISFSYGAPWEPGSGRGWRTHLWRNRPCCFLHFELWRSLSGPPPFPRGARPAILAGRSGLLAPATGPGMACGGGDAGAFFCNHLRFRWRERGSWFVATLHAFGRSAETRRLLERILRTLRPIRTLRPGSPRVVATIAVGGSPNALAAGDGTVWVIGTSRAGGYLARISTRTNAVTARLRLPVGSERACGIAVAGGSVWAAGYTRTRTTRGSLIRVDGHTGRAQLPLPGAACVAAAGGSVWVTSPETRSVFRVDTGSGRLLARIRNAGAYPTGIAASRDAVWVVSSAPPCGGPHRPCTPRIDERGSLVRIDPHSNRIVSRLRVPASPEYAALAGTNLWVTSNDGALRRVDARRNRLAAPAVRVTGGRTTVAFALGYLWSAAIVGPGAAGTLTAIDPGSGKPAANVTVGESPLGMAARDGVLWVANFNSGTVSRIER